VGTAAASLLIVAAAAAVAHADPCTGVTPGGGRFALCFDPGNRLSVTAGSEGFGGGIALRQVIHFSDEPDLVWKLEHVVLDGTHSATSGDLDAVVYRGRYMRHARDGHLVIPLGVPKKIFLPFDVGGLTEVGSVRWRDNEPSHIGIVKLGGILDFARTRTWNRLAFGPVATWEVDVTRDQHWDLGEHTVAPFSLGMANLHYESNNGRFVADLRVEAGMAWHSLRGWGPEARAEASIERVLLAINDRPIALTLGARYDRETSEAIARVGARIVLFDHRDPRVARLD